MSSFLQHYKLVFIQKVRSLLVLEKNLIKKNIY